MNAGNLSTQQGQQPRLRGIVCMPKSHFCDDVWLCEPFSTGQAWLDLWALANDRRRLLKIRGVEVFVERGQVAHSLQSLAERWHWSRDKVRRFLGELQDGRKVRVESGNLTTMVTVLDYTLFNPDTEPELPLEPTAETTAEPTAKATAETTAEPAVEPTAEPTQKRGSRGIAEGEIGEQGKGNAPCCIEIPSNEDVATFCRSWPGDLARGIPGAIPDGWWTGWLAAKLTSPRGFPGQWERTLVLAFVSDWVNGHPKARGTDFKKNPAAGRGAVQANGQPASGREEGDAGWWWTDPVSALEGALNGAVLAGQEKNAARLRVIIQERTR